MDIPTDIPKRINPNWLNPVSKSIVYTPRALEYTANSNQDIIIKFRYSKDTFWTNFKVTTIGQAPRMLPVSIVIVTDDGEEYVISDENRYSNQWYDTVWPIPSVKTDNENAGVYLRIHNTDTIVNYNYSIRVTIVGFMDLFPKYSKYMLLSNRDTYEFAFLKYEDEGDPIDNRQGSIYHIDEYNYRGDMMDVCGIRLINRY